MLTDNVLLLLLLQAHVWLLKHADILSVVNIA